MSAVHLEIELPEDLARFRLPPGVQQRLQSLLDRQEEDRSITSTEHEEAEGLVNLADFFSLLRLRAERVSGSSV